MQNAMDRMLHDSYGPGAVARDAQVHIPVDVQADDEAYLVRALVPSLTSDDLEIQILEDTVTIRGELKALQGEDDEVLLREIPTGRFQRTLRLPVSLDAANAEATIENGVLHLRVLKAEEARPKIIQVQAK
jgi:HSP20 family protein